MAGNYTHAWSYTMPLFATQVVTTFYHVDENSRRARNIAELMDDALRAGTEDWGLVDITVSQPYTRSLTAIEADNAEYIAQREANIAAEKAARAQ